MAYDHTVTRDYYADFTTFAPSEREARLDLLARTQDTADAFRLRPGQLLKFTATGEVVTAFDEPVALTLVRLDTEGA